MTRRPSFVRRLRPGLLASLALLAALLAHYIFLAPVERRFLFYNGDTLYLPALYADLVAGGDPALWAQPNALFLFPDGALMFLLLALTRNLYLAITLYGVVQILLFIVGLAMLARRVTRQPALVALVPLAGAIFFLALPHLHLAFSLSIVSMYHFGPVLLLPFALALAHDLLLAPSRMPWPRAFALTALVALGVAGNILFLFQTITPLLLMPGLLALARLTPPRRAALLAALLAAGAGAGLALDRAASLVFPVRPVVPVELGVTTTLAALASVLARAPELLRPLPLLGPLWLAFMVGAVVLVVRGLLRPARRPADAGRLLVVGAIALGVIVNLAVVILSGKDGERYFLPALIFPCCFGWPLLIAAAWPGGAGVDFSFARAFPAVASSLVIMFALPALRGLPTLAGHLDYYPPLVRCVDEQARRLGLRAGMAHYWQARPIALFSKADVVAASARDKLEPRHWVNTLADFRRPFDFVLVDTTMTAPDLLLDEGFIRARFGPPAAVADCGPTRLLSYNRPSDVVFHEHARHSGVVVRVDLPGEPVRFAGAFLPREVGVDAGLDRRADGRQGHLIKSPNLALEPGTYMFRIDYSASGPGPRPGYWDVLVYNADGAEVVVSADVPADGSSVRAVFGLSEPAQVEIRVLYEGPGPLTIRSLTIERLGKG